LRVAGCGLRVAGCGLRIAEGFRNGVSKKGCVPELWDGKAAERIVEIILDS